MNLVQRNLERHGNWEKSVGVLARLVRSLSASNPTKSPEERRVLIQEDPDVKELQEARRLQILFSQKESKEALQQGRLVPMGGRLVSGTVVVTGRVDEVDLANMLGKPYLPVIWASTKLARLIVRYFHQEDHRMTPSDVVARTRRVVWIPRCLALAKSEIKSCFFCLQSYFLEH